MFARAVAVLGAVLCLADVSAFAQPQSSGPSSAILFENVRIFDGKSSTLSGSMNVLVRGNTIDRISKDPIAVDRSASTDRKSTRLNSSHLVISYAVFCLKKKKKQNLGM